jgi:hypothetical protein
LSTFSTPSGRLSTTRSVATKALGNSMPVPGPRATITGLCTRVSSGLGAATRRPALPKRSAPGGVAGVPLARGSSKLMSAKPPASRWLAALPSACCTCLLHLPAAPACCTRRGQGPAPWSAPWR